jgi:zona occludens toxin (predicted ATPase)
VVAATPLVATTAAAVATAAEAHHMALAEELVAAAIAEAEAKRIATSPVTIYNDKHIITK